MAKKKSHDPATGVEIEVDVTDKIWVVAKQDRRMRAGLEFTREPREVEVTEDQFRQIAADPMLAIMPNPAFLASPDA